MVACRVSISRIRLEIGCSRGRGLDAGQATEEGEDPDGLVDGLAGVVIDEGAQVESVGEVIHR